VNLFTYILIVGIIIGLFSTVWVKGLKITIFIVVGIIGAFIGAFLVFGDAPFLLKYGHILNEKTSPIIVSFLFVLFALLINKKISKN